MRKTQEEADKTKQSILKASIRIFIEKGYAHTKMEDIANAANVTRGAIYWHFKNKEEILIRLADDIYNETSDKIQTFFSYGTSLREKLSKTLKNLCYWYLEDDDARMKRSMLMATFANRDRSLMDKVFLSLHPEESAIPGDSEIMAFVSSRIRKSLKIDPVAYKSQEIELSEAFLSIVSFVDGLISIIIRIPGVIKRENVDDIIERFMEGFFHSYKHILEAK